MKQKKKQKESKANKPTPPIEELEVILGAAVYNIDAEADEDNPDPLSNVCDLVRDAYSALQLVKKNHEAIIGNMGELAQAARHYLKLPSDRNRERLLKVEDKAEKLLLEVSG